MRHRWWAVVAAQLISICLLAGWMVREEEEEVGGARSPLRSLPDCRQLFAPRESPHYNHTVVEEAKRWQFDAATARSLLRSSRDPCALLRDMCFKGKQTLEELNYPLAYAMLVYKNALQVYYQLSSFYRPQHSFCVAVPGNAEPGFYEEMLTLQHCFPNVHVMRVAPIKWCSYEILTAVFACVEYLSRLDSPWQYLQYLSGVDMALKTNLEMVRIFKALNGSFNAEIKPFEYYRLMRRRRVDSPLPLFKTSLSATFSRASADFMIKSDTVRKQIAFLNGTLCADESLWATIAGNPTKLAMPGGFDGAEFMSRSIIQRYIPKFEPSYNEDYSEYYIARYQQWELRKSPRCYGKMVRGSCVFGVADLPDLVSRRELVAHKLYIDYQPAAFFCLLNEIHRRTAHPNPAFSTLPYSQPRDAPIRTL